MRNATLFLVLVLTSTHSFSQSTQKSKLYDDTGRLYADTTLKINSAQLQSWAIVEANILGKLAKQIEYPPASFRNGLSGKAIIGFDYYGDSISNIRFYSKKLGGDLESFTMQSFKNNKTLILGEFKAPQTAIDEVTITKGTYFIPIIFEQLDFEQEVRKNHALPIIKISNPNIFFITR